MAHENTILVRMAASPLAARKGIATSLGEQFGGDRDIYDAAGYPTDLSFDDFYARYRRQGLGYRVIAAPARESWRKAPELLDGKDEKGSTTSAFVKAWEELNASALEFDDIESDGQPLLHYLRQVDVESGIGQYGCLLLGLNDTEDFTQPVRKGGAKELLYTAVYNEGNAKIDAYDTNVKSRRYGLPVSYSLTTSNGTMNRVHWSRIIHVAEGGRVFGTPRLEAVYNDLFDMHKLSAATGEAAWRLLLPVFMASTAENYGLTGRVSDDTLEKEVDEFINGLRRWINLEGMDVTVIDGKIVDPRPVAAFYVSLIAGATSIPQRLLLGSERGELASSQDEQNWANVVMERRTSHVAPNILLPTLRRLVYAGVLPMPSSGSVFVKWPALLDSDETELAGVGEKLANITSAMGWTVTDVKAYVSTYFPSADADSFEEKPEPEPMPVNPLAPGNLDVAPAADVVTPEQDPAAVEKLNGRYP